MQGYITLNLQIKELAKMKKRILITILILTLLPIFAVTTTGCGASSDPNMNTIATGFREQGFIVEVEDGSPFMMAMRFGGGYLETIMLFQFSTLAGVEAGYDMVKDFIDHYDYAEDEDGYRVYDANDNPIIVRPFYGQVASYYGLFVWLGTTAAHDLASYIIKGEGSVPRFLDQSGYGNLNYRPNHLALSVARFIEVFEHDDFGFSVTKETSDLEEEMGLANTTMTTLSVENGMDFILVMKVEPPVAGLMHFMLNETLNSFGDDLSFMVDFLDLRYYFSDTLLWVGTPKMLTIFNYVLDGTLDCPYFPKPN